MQKSNAPTPFTVAFANGAGSGYRNTIPIPSQIPITPGAASYTDGFPPVTMEPSGSGGIPPYGADMNGVLYAATLATLWEQAGFMQSYNSTLSTAYGGYPAQSLLVMGSGLGLWLSTADNNTTSPDATGSSGWIPVLGNAGKTVMNVTGGTFTPDPSVLGVKMLYLQGTLTSNLTLVLPLTAGASWKIYNNTSGSFTVNAGGATGTSVAISQGGYTDVTTDGTNFYTSVIAGGPYLPLAGTAVAATKLATARTIAITGDLVWSVSFDGSANVTAAGTIQAAAVTLAKMANFQANSLMGNPTSSSATPSAITLQNGLVFSGTNLGLGAITVTGMTVSGTGNVSIGGSITSVTNVAASGTISGAGITTNGIVTCAEVAINGAASTTYSVVQITNPSGVEVQIAANGNADGEFRTVTNHPINFLTSNTQAASISVGGNFTIAGTSFTSSTTSVILAATGAGSISLRPNGSGSATGQAQVSTSGVLALNPTGNILTNGSLFAGLVVSGNFGGGITLVDGTYNWTLYDNAGTLTIGAATSGGGPGAQLQLTTAGNLSITGTSNNQTSDARVKTNFIAREPQPSHHLWWGDYDRTDIEAHGIGNKAQDAQQTHPHHVSENPIVKIPGTNSPMLMLDRLGMAEEQGIWCGRRIDEIFKRLTALESKV